MLVSGAASGQDKLSQAAQSSAKTITQLTDVVKLGATSIGSDDPETQVDPQVLLPLLSFASSVCQLPVAVEERAGNASSPSHSGGLVINLGLSPCPLPQVVLINAVKDVAKALAELISATKCAAGKAADDPSMYQLKSAAKVSRPTGVGGRLTKCFRFDLK